MRELDHEEGWVLKNGRFQTVVWILESPLDHTEEINPEDSLEELMLKLKLQYFGHLIEKSWLIGKDPDAGKDWGQEEKRVAEYEMAGCITDSMAISLSKLLEIVKDREAWRVAVYGPQRVGHELVTEQQYPWLQRHMSG